MTEAQLIDLAPVLELMALAALLALGPVAWLFWRHRGRSPKELMALLVGITLFLTFDLVVFGAFTRLSDSGLGCPDWPGCYGTLSPWAAVHPISQAQAAMPTGPVTHFKAWVEMIHRYAAMVVGVLIIIQVILAWHWRKHLKPTLPLALITLFWVCLQGAFGAWTVTLKLQPVIVTGHLLGGMTLLLLLRWQHIRLNGALPMAEGDRRLKSWAWITLAVVYVQLFLGAWVSTNYAVLACQDFPTCQGSWWPDMNFSAGYELWRPLGRDGTGQPIAFAALTAIHYVHRMFAFVVLALLWWVGAQLRRQSATRGIGNAIWAIGLWQLFSGVTNVVLQWPLLAALAHTAGAAALVIVITGWLARHYVNKELL